MQIELWQLLLGFFGTMLGSSIPTALVTSYMNRNAVAEAVKKAQLENRGAEFEFKGSVEERAEKVIAEKFADKQQITNLEGQLKVEQLLRKDTSQSLQDVFMKIGGLTESEKNCKEAQHKLETDMRDYREQTEARMEERHLETMRMFKQLHDVLKDCVITRNPVTNEN